MPIPSVRLHLLVLTAAHACVFSNASLAQTPANVLPAIVISAPTPTAGDTASVGGFSEAPLYKTPASITVITLDQMRDLGIRQTAGAMKVDASVNESYNAVGYAEQFSIRGFALDNTSSYRKDGLPISSDAPIPLENKERIEILKGLAGLQAGIATPGGILNYVTKRPTATPVRSVMLEASERGTLYGAIDLGGQSEDRRFGYRINAAAEKLRSYIKGADGERQFVSAAFDWHITPNALLQLDVDNQHKAQLTAPGFQLLNGTDLPTNIAASTMLNNQAWSKPVKTDSSNIGLRFDYQINTDWRASLSANQHTLRRDDFTAFPYGCASANLFPGFCANGDYDVYDYQSANEKKSLLASKALLQGKLTTGSVQHALTVGIDTFRRRDEFGDCVYGTVDCAGSLANGTSNIYNPSAVSPSTIVTGPVLLRRSGNEKSVFVQDVVSFNDRVALHAGVRSTQIRRDQYDVTGTLNAQYDRHYLLPNVALVLNPTRDWSVYGSFAEGLEHGGIAPAFTTNVNQMLDPNKSKQVEVGVKALLAQDWTMSAALFQIKKPLEYTDSNFTFVRNGNAIHRGVELAAQGLATRALMVGLSMTALKTQQENTGLSTLEGKRVTNVPEFKSTVFVDYAVPQMSGVNVNGNWQYAGNKAFNPDNSVTVPGYHVFNLGARYATRVAGLVTTLRFNVDNVLDKFYWRDVTQSLGGYLMPGAPRTFKISAQLDF